MFLMLKTDRAINAAGTLFHLFLRVFKYHKVPNSMQLLATKCFAFLNQFGLKCQQIFIQDTVLNQHTNQTLSLIDSEQQEMCVLSLLFFFLLTSAKEIISYATQKANRQILDPKLLKLFKPQIDLAITVTQQDSRRGSRGMI